MKIKESFILREIVGEYILIPVGETATKISGIISLSESGHLLYEKLLKGCKKEDLVKVILSEYEVEEEQATTDVEAFLEQMRQIGILTEG